MPHQLSTEDREFVGQVESCKFPLEKFNHYAHLRLAYVYLAEHDAETAHQLMRDTLQNFLAHNGIDPSKYHETMTHAWILAVRHFMEVTPGSGSANSFIEKNPEMLDSKIMMTHYSAEVLFQEKARQSFVEHNLDPIPIHRE